MLNAPVWEGQYEDEEVAHVLAVHQDAPRRILCSYVTPPPVVRRSMGLQMTGAFRNCGVLSKVEPRLGPDGIPIDVSLPYTYMAETFLRSRVRRFVRGLTSFNTPAVDLTFVSIASAGMTMRPNDADTVLQHYRDMGAAVPELLSSDEKMKDYEKRQHCFWMAGMGRSGYVVNFRKVLDEELRAAGISHYEKRTHVDSVGGGSSVRVMCSAVAIDDVDGRPTGDMIDLLYPTNVNNPPDFGTREQYKRLNGGREPSFVDLLQGASVSYIKFSSQFSVVYDTAMRRFVERAGLPRRHMGGAHGNSGPWTGSAFIVYTFYYASKRSSIIFCDLMRCGPDVKMYVDQALHPVPGMKISAFERTSRMRYLVSVLAESLGSDGSNLWGPERHGDIDMSKRGILARLVGGMLCSLPDVNSEVMFLLSLDYVSKADEQLQAAEGAMSLLDLFVRAHAKYWDLAPPQFNAGDIPGSRSRAGSAVGGRRVSAVNLGASRARSDSGDLLTSGMLANDAGRLDSSRGVQELSPSAASAVSASGRWPRRRVGSVLAADGEVGLDEASNLLQLAASAGRGLESRGSAISGITDMLNTYADGPNSRRSSYVLAPGATLASSQAMAGEVVGVGGPNVDIAELAARSTRALTLREEQVTTEENRAMREACKELATIAEEGQRELNEWKVRALIAQRQVIELEISVTESQQVNEEAIRINDELTQAKKELEEELEEMSNNFIRQRDECEEVKARHEKTSLHVIGLSNERKKLYAELDVLRQKTGGQPVSASSKHASSTLTAGRASLSPVHGQEQRKGANVPPGHAIPRLPPGIGLRHVADGIPAASGPASLGLNLSPGRGPKSVRLSPRGMVGAGPGGVNVVPLSPVRGSSGAPPSGRRSPKPTTPRLESRDLDLKIDMRGGESVNNVARDHEKKRREEAEALLKERDAEVERLRVDLQRERAKAVAAELKGKLDSSGEVGLDALSERFDDSSDEDSVRLSTAGRGRGGASIGRPPLPLEGIRGGGNTGRGNGDFAMLRRLEGELQRVNLENDVLRRKERLAKKRGVDLEFAIKKMQVEVGDTAAHLQDQYAKLEVRVLQVLASLNNDMTDIRASVTDVCDIVRDAQSGVLTDALRQLEQGSVGGMLRAADDPGTLWTKLDERITHVDKVVGESVSELFDGIRTVSERMYDAVATVASAAFRRERLFFNRNCALIGAFNPLVAAYESAVFALKRIIAHPVKFSGDNKPIQSSSDVSDRRRSLSRPRGGSGAADNLSGRSIGSDLDVSDGVFVDASAVKAVLDALSIASDYEARLASGMATVEKTTTDGKHARRPGGSENDKDGAGSDSHSVGSDGEDSMSNDDDDGDLFAYERSKLDELHHAAMKSEKAAMKAAADVGRILETFEGKMNGVSRVVTRERAAQGAALEWERARFSEARQHLVDRVQRLENDLRNGGSWAPPRDHAAKAGRVDQDGRDMGAGDFQELMRLRQDMRHVESDRTRALDEVTRLSRVIEGLEEDIRRLESNLKQEERRANGAQLSVQMLERERDFVRLQQSGQPGGGAASDMMQIRQEFNNMLMQMASQQRMAAQPQTNVAEVMRLESRVRESQEEAQMWRSKLVARVNYLKKKLRKYTHDFEDLDPLA